MLDLQQRIATLKRPSLLARAARFGVDEYRREVHLRRLFGQDTLPRHGAALIRLLEMEDEIDQKRRSHCATYRAARHVELLIALLGEAQLMRATTLRAVAP